MKRKVVTLGTRGSALALWQARWVAEQLTWHRPDLDVRLVTIKTKGDKIEDVALARIGDRGLFIKELEEALLSSRVDLAVHSMKDVPAAVAPGLTIAAVAERGDPRDALVGAGSASLAALPTGACLGTSSLRRKAQLWHFRPDLVLEDLRGNVPTRLARMRERNLDGIVVAAAGLIRLGLDHYISEYLPPSVCLPAAGQGAIGLEVRKTDHDLLELAALVNHPDTAAAVRAERAFLAVMEGGCQVPLGVLGRVEGKNLQLEGLVASLDGCNIVRGSLTGKPEEAAALGRLLAEELLHSGAGEILRQIRS